MFSWTNTSFLLPEVLTVILLCFPDTKLVEKDQFVPVEKYLPVT